MDRMPEEEFEEDTEIVEPSSPPQKQVQISPLEEARLAHKKHLYPSLSRSSSYSIEGSDKASDSGTLVGSDDESEPVWMNSPSLEETTISSPTSSSQSQSQASSSKPNKKSPNRNIPQQQKLPESLQRKAQENSRSPTKRSATGDKIEVKGKEADVAEEVRLQDQQRD